MTFIDLPSLACGRYEGFNPKRPILVHCESVWYLAASTFTIIIFLQKGKNCRIKGRTMYQNWPFWVKTPITSTSGIARLYKLQGSFIILLGVYCEFFFFRGNLGNTSFLRLKGFSISYAYALFDVQHGKSR